MTEQASRDDVAQVAPERHRGNRMNIWALAVGACGVVVAIVALVIAISANHTTNDDAKIANAVRIAENRQIHGVRADLRRNVTAATVLLKRLQRSSANAHHADAKLRRDVSATKNGVTSNRSQITTANANISRLQTAVGGLNADVKSLTTSVTSQKRAQQALAQRVKKLQKTVASLP